MSSLLERIAARRAELAEQAQHLTKQLTDGSTGARSLLMSWLACFWAVVRGVGAGGLALVASGYLPEAPEVPA
ncbi:hypothetical protein ITP53_20920 [Nonomuraea sp. K274]|uniref:Uncharacterized protein n=1 Tax=Nonomuraea cypriaca TaxID=1187855 RepID=A0A931EZA5_9ACTN|nr:hypothetical protein [Nonomuraea cypriaca]MBF8188150.1 hypothetical protein [Nonomuraea cypriaca]